MNPYKDLFQEINYHLLDDKEPSKYLDSIINHKEFEMYPFNMLCKLKDTKQSLRYHPEGNVWNHTLMVVDEGAKVKNKSNNVSAFMWAALLHDIGKPSTTKTRGDKITSYDHDKVGAELSRDFLSEFMDNIEFINKVYYLIRYHMHILFVLNKLPFGDIKGMKEYGDIYEVALLGLCDRLGRGGCDRTKEENNVKLFIEKCIIN
ncbi:HDIG domain-containing metalloprotein [Clostridium sp. WILCCON 0269]|uniref:HDIG domain-containing metalloprotein n=1 Tax=Candidatus Clostridium eludens TaxID=3381663 RepID=A0ABW8SKI7_9CLOT